MGGSEDYLVAENNFHLFLDKIANVVGICSQLFLSTSRKELSRPYAQFEGMSFKEMTDILILEDKLHCFDVSYIQHFILSLLKWDTLNHGEYKESIITSLKEAQDYEPLPTGSPLPSVQLNDNLDAEIFIAQFFDVHCVSYEVMLTLKYALSHLLCLSRSTFQYVGWVQTNKGCQISWKTFPENFEKIGHQLRYYPSTGALAVIGDYDPYQITFNCKIINMQILLDGTPLLYPDLDGR